MEKKHHSLEYRETNKFISIIRVIFGILCIGVSIFWLVYNFRSVKADNTLWITVIFLAGFGAWLAWTGFGYGYRFIEISNGQVRVKKNSFLPEMIYNNHDVSLIEVYPLKVVFHLKSGKQELIRFGVSDIEKVELIKDDLLIFAEENNISTELKNEM